VELVHRTDVDVPKAREAVLVTAEALSETLPVGCSPQNSSGEGNVVRCIIKRQKNYCTVKVIPPVEVVSVSGRGS
jgi:hypothetical protein